jgi:hypothetical protein
MTNLHFIAKYILEHPEKTRYNEIIRNLMLWKGFSAEDIVDIGGQYSRYFTKLYGRYSKNTYEYHGQLWVKIDPKNRMSGYKLTEAGIAKAREAIEMEKG